MGVVAGLTVIGLVYWNSAPRNCEGHRLYHQMHDKEFPPLQAPETYNLDGILKQVQAANANHPSG